MNQTTNAHWGLLIVLPHPIRFAHGQFLVAQEARMLLDEWLESFEAIVVAAPLMPHDWNQLEQIQWCPTDLLPFADRVEWIPLPWVDSWRSVWQCHKATRSQLMGLISRASCLQFYLRGELKDWGCIAAQEANRQQRTYAMQTIEDDWLPAPQTQSLEHLLIDHGSRWLTGLWHSWLRRRCYAAWAAKLHTPTPTIGDRFLDGTELLLSRVIWIIRQVQGLLPPIIQTTRVTSLTQQEEYPPSNAHPSLPNHPSIS